MMKRTAILYLYACRLDFSSLLVPRMVRVLSACISILGNRGLFAGSRTKPESLDDRLLRKAYLCPARRW
jgi:hypothetical protein